MAYHSWTDEEERTVRRVARSDGRRVVNYAEIEAALAALGTSRTRKSLAEKIAKLRAAGWSPAEGSGGATEEERSGPLAAPPPGRETGQDERSISRDLGDSNGCVTVRSADIRTIDQALAVADVDTEEWEPYRSVINSWEVTAGTQATGTECPETYTNFQVKVWLRRKGPPPLVQQVIEGMIDARGGRAPRIRPRKGPAGRDLAAMVALYDAHFGKLAWAAETGENYDLRIAEACYLSAAQQMIDRIAPYRPAQIYLPVGQDFLHIDNAANQTVHGTPQDVDGRIEKICTVAAAAVERIVALCAELAPVEVVYVPGNHDPHTSFFVLMAVDAYYRQEPRITVDLRPMARKYRRWGACLMGFTHGSEESFRDLPTVMASEAPDDWGPTTHREWYVGHWHKRRQMMYSAGDTHGAVSVRVIPSLSGTDKWHFSKGYVKTQRAAEAYLLHREEGYYGHLAVNVPATP